MMMPVLNKSYRAFTILELLVVISVLTILITIGIPKIKGFMDNAKNAQARKELQTMQAALESYYTFSTPKAYPPTTTTVSSTYLLNSTPQLIKATLKDPFTGASNSEYNYAVSANGKYYVAYSVGYNASGSGVEISNTGQTYNLDADDICVTNGRGCSSGELRCASGQSEVQGLCCDSTTPDVCSGTCVNLQCDTSNCGSCGTVCGGGDSCCGGSCEDPASMACMMSACPVGF